MTSARRVVFLDRDGVLTVPDERDGKGFAVSTLEDLRFYPDAASSVGLLSDAGYDVVVVTNQPDVARGLITPGTLEHMHARVTEVTGVTRVRTCPHARGDDCACRKPLPGLLFDEARHEPLDVAESWMVGDRDSDVEAGRAFGVRTVFIDRDWSGEVGRGATAVVSSLADAVVTILRG